MQPPPLLLTMQVLSNSLLSLTVLYCYPSTVFLMYTDVCFSGKATEKFTHWAIECA